MAYRVAVVGATGTVGREMINILEERRFPVAALDPLASLRTAGSEVAFRDRHYLVKDLDGFDFSATDIVLSSAGARVSEAFAPKAAQAGAVVIDNTSFFRMEPDIPLIVPEVNPEALKDYRRRNIIANPNCTTIQLVVALKPLHDAFGIDRVVVTTFQSTSGAGKEAMDELFYQTKGIYQNEAPKDHQSVFPKQIAFNVIPHIDAFMADGATKEEWKIRAETGKILDPAIHVAANCARVPTFIGHGEYVNLSFHNPFTEAAIRDLLEEASGVVLLDRRTDGGYMTPAEVAGEDAVFVSRLREDTSVPNGLSFWCVANNIRKGAALNAVQIAELLIQNGLAPKET